MYQTILSFRPLQYLSAALIAFMLSSSAHAASSTTGTDDNSAPILVTIKPLYSLVAHLTEGIEKPVLLMTQAQSPHHYSMRPSERRLLANARIIIWLGPQMESYLSGIIQQQQHSALVITALHAPDLQLLSKRREHSHEAMSSSNTIRPESHMIDPHVWLSTGNAIAISKQITEVLIKNTPNHAVQYKNNLQRLIKKIEQTKKFIKTTLKTSSQPFIAYHDAFQYFEHENKLNHIDSISFGDETGTGLKHMREIKNQIDNNNIQCLVYQEPEPAIVRSLTRQSTINATALDPLGLNISDSKNAWFELMRQLAINFSLCLNP